MNEDLTTYFRNLIDQLGSFDIAQAEFYRLVNEDDELSARYEEWCEENGYTRRRGFHIFCEEVLNSQNSAMDSLNDYDDER